jgi:NADPH2:quinone reductase
MRAVIVHAFGKENGRIAFGEAPEPSPGPDELLIRIDAVAVNFVDLLVIDGNYQFLPDPPFSPGKLPVGTVLAIGDAVRGFKAGDRVLTMAEQGGYAEQIAVPCSQCFPLPDSLSVIDAASMALAFDTAWFALYARARLQPGDSVLVLGATGAVGHAAIQLAKAKGARVLAGISGPHRAAAARDAGADGLIDLSAKDLRDSLRAQVHAQTDGKGVDIVLDPLGGDIFDAAIRALAWGGRLVVIGFAAGRIPTLKANYLLLKNIEVSGLQISDYRRRMPDRMAECFRDIFALYDTGALRPLPATTFALANFADALALIRTRKAAGRIVLLPQAGGGP